MRLRRLLSFALIAAATLPVHAAGELPEDWQDRIRLGVRAYDKGDHRVAFDFFYKLMAEGGRSFGPGDSRMVRLYTNMGEIYSEEEQYAYADSCLKKGLNVAQKAFGADSPQCLPALIDLGQMYVKEGKDAFAKPQFEKALAICAKSTDDSLLSYEAVVETNLGSMYFAEGNYGSAEPHFKRASELAAKAFGPTHRWSTTIGGMYASCLGTMGRTKEAKSIEKAARQKANEGNSPFSKWNRQIAVVEDDIAMKHWSDAEIHAKLALQTAKELYIEPMLEVVTLTKYGDIYLTQNKPALALNYMKQAQTLADNTMGADNEVVLQHAIKLAELEKAQQQFADAEPLYIRWLSYQKKKFGPESDEYAKALKDAADIETAWAQYPKAATYYGKLLSMQEKKYGADNEKLIPTLVALGSASQVDMKYLAEVNGKAEDIFKRAADIATKHYGKDSKEVASILDALSRFYQRHYEWEKATKTCTLVVAANEKVFGPKSPETIKALEHYALVLRAAGLRNEAENVEAKIGKLKPEKTAVDD